MLASDFAILVLGTCSFPLLCLLRARYLLHAGDLAGVVRLTGIARVWSAGLMGGGAAIVAILYWQGPPNWRQPEGIASLGAPVPIWFWSMTLCARARERQDEAARLAAPTPRDAGGGPAAPG